MLQNIAGKMVEVVEFDTMPELPITGRTASEQAYISLTDCFSHGPYGTLASTTRGMTITYAQALTDAIETGIITEPGKYGIELLPAINSYHIYKIIEP